MTADIPPAGVRRRDAAATRARILAAAEAEFGAHGFAGARVKTIADAAQSNQRMIYEYFDNKAGLFDAVLDATVATAQSYVAFDATALPSYAVAVFDHYRAHPSIVRLALWQSLERPGALRANPLVQAALEQRIGAIAAAQSSGEIRADIDAHRLFDTILLLAQGSAIEDNDSERFTDERRRALLGVVERLTETS